MRGLFPLALVAGCAVPPPLPPVVAAPAPTVGEAAAWTFRPNGREELSLVGGGRHLVVKWASLDFFGSETLVESLVVDGALVFPTDCAAPGPLCTTAHQTMRDEHGSRAEVVRVRVTADRIDLLVAGVFPGSPECGAYGYYVLRIDAAGVRASDPVRGCFVGATPDQPRVDAGPPWRLTTVDSGMTFEVVTMTLDDETLDFTVTRKPR